MTIAADYTMLDLMVRPALLLTDNKIEHANPAAQFMLGAHIEGQDIRLALRHPKVVALVLGNIPGSVKITGLSTAGSLWEVTSHDLDNDRRLVTLEDLRMPILSPMPAMNCGHRLPRCSAMSKR
jgi:two-component system, OmpR family, phosphate regulon sensor histidine kinase PhoR